MLKESHKTTHERENSHQQIFGLGVSISIGYGGIALCKLARQDTVGGCGLVPQKRSEGKFGSKNIGFDLLISQEALNPPPIIVTHSSILLPSYYQGFQIKLGFLYPSI